MITAAPTTAKSLLLGCGNSREKKVAWASSPDWAGDLFTIDMDPNCGADIVHDLNNHPLPFKDETFDELGAYDVLEHLGRQGDWRGWFDEMAEYHRILKPGGLFSILVPIGPDAFADPGHTRFFHSNHFGFLTRRFYEDQRAKQTSAADYRWYIKHWWELEYIEDVGGHHLAVILRKV